MLRIAYFLQKQEACEGEYSDLVAAVAIFVNIAPFDLLQSQVSRVLVPVYQTKKELVSK